MLGAIDKFESKAISDKRTLFGTNGRKELDAFEQRIQKEIFAAANAATSLVDYVRRVTSVITVPNFDDRRVEAFGSDGLHEFVQNLRVLLSHIRAVEVGWNLADSIAEGKSATFKLDKVALLNAIDDSDLSHKPKTRQYVQSAGDILDLRTIFKNYATRVAKFYTWFEHELASSSIVELRDYERCLIEIDRCTSRMMWNAILGNVLNWKVRPNPHHYLVLFLTKDQLAEVRRQPRNTKQQIDLVIKLIDQNLAITDGIRDQVYRLFEHSPRYNWQDQPQWVWRMATRWFRKWRRNRKASAN